MLGERNGEALRHLAAWWAHQVGPDQRVVWSDHTLRGVCGADEAGSALGISAVSAHPSQAYPGSAVGLNRKPGVRTRGSHPSITSVPLVVRPPSVFLLPHQGLYKHAEPGKRPKEAQCPVLSILLVDARRVVSPGKAFYKLINEKVVCLLRYDVAWRTA